MVTINGEEKNVAGKTIYAYLSEEGYDTSRVVVEQNLQIIPRISLNTDQEGDQIEILCFVGEAENDSHTGKNAGPYFKKELERAFDANFHGNEGEILQRPVMAVAGLGGLGSNIAVMLAKWDRTFAFSGF
ncbi:MAG: sulfur carrier protein ThiS [Clostridium sp.]